HAAAGCPGRTRRRRTVERRGGAQGRACSVAERPPALAPPAPVEQEPRRLRGPGPLQAPLREGPAAALAAGLRPLLRPLGSGLPPERRGRRGARPPPPHQAAAPAG